MSRREPPRPFELSRDVLVVAQYCVRRAPPISERDATHAAARVSEAVRGCIERERGRADPIELKKAEFRCLVTKTERLADELGLPVEAAFAALKKAVGSADKVKPGPRTRWDRRRLFGVLSDVYEQLCERPYRVSVDKETNASRGEALEWTLAVLAATPLSKWAATHREGVADLIAWVAKRRRYLDAANDPSAAAALLKRLAKRKGKFSE